MTLKPPQSNPRPRSRRRESKSLPNHNPIVAGESRKENNPHDKTTGMKIFLLFLFFIGFSHADEIPSDVKNLLEKRDNAVSAIDKRLVEELEKLKVNYTKRGDLESANAVVELISKYKPTEGDENANKDMKNALIGTMWVWFNQETITFEDSNKALYNSNQKKLFTWEITDEKERIISGMTPGGRAYKMQFSKNFKKARIFDGAVERDTNIMKE
jgi:hypothetical protein